MTTRLERLTSREARAARRQAYWDRPRPSRDWRYWVGGAGRVLTITGLLMFGFVAYQLWGTGLEYAQAQNRLDDELEELFAEAGVPPTASTATSTANAPAVTDPATTPPSTTATDPSLPPTSASTAPTTPGTIPVPLLEEGQGFAWLDIPRVGLDDIVVVAGVTPSVLKEGPGHYPGTPMPGQLGNASIAGHRTTFGQPFFRLDELQPGDEIVLTTVQGTFVYVVTGSEIVPPDRGDVVLTTDPDVARLTLTTCDPKWTATNRLIVRAELDPSAGSAAQPADLSYGPGVAPADPATAPSAPATLPGDEAATATAATGTTSTSGSVPATTPTASTPSTSIGASGVATPAQVEDAFAQGWFSDTDAWPQVALWGLLTAAVAGLGYLVARLLRRRWVGWAIAAVPFALTLYFFYQNVNRLLPAAL